MPVENLKLYQSWELEQPILPERSRLFSLPPVGVGTAIVEGLSSYLIRLADAHGITVGDLIRYYIAPLFFLNEQPPGLSKKDAIELVVVRLRKELAILQQPTAQFWLSQTQHVSKVVNVLEILTGRKDISYLTLLPWKTWRLSFNHIFHTQQRWCAGCYQDWRDANTPVYQPLLWALEPVTVCPYHQRYLQIYCLCYGHTQLFFQPQKLNGYCHECGAWLGRNLDLPSHSRSKGRKFDRDLWIAQALGNLLAATPSLHTNPLIRETKVSPKRTLPTLYKFLRWCYKLSLSPVEGLNLLEIQ